MLTIKQLFAAGSRIEHHQDDYHWLLVSSRWVHQPFYLTWAATLGLSLSAAFYKGFPQQWFGA
jgi:hypothetical protein